MVDSAKQDPEYLYLTTTGRRSRLPREIEIWFVQAGGRYYVIAEHATANWVRNLVADARVSVRIGGERFPAVARVIEPEIDPGLHSRIQDLSEKKYGWGDGVVVELNPLQQKNAPLPAGPEP